MLEYAYENQCPWHEETCEFAAERGHLEVLKYAHENKCPSDWSACYRAAFKCGDHSRMLIHEYLRKNNLLPSTP